MKAVVLRSYGSPDHLELTAADQPVPADGEVLVRVRATSVNPYDWHFMRGEPRVARLMPGGMGLRGPKISILGCDMAGQVEAVGRSVTRFGPGDEVFALLPGGGFGEYVTVPETQLARKPGNLSFEQAAAVPMAAVTALIGLRDQGRLQSGHKVLVNGASGGVGTFAVQIARAFGATVTGVCGARHVDLVRSIGADEVIDYGKQDFTRCGNRYDLVLDVAGSRPARACRKVMTRQGRLVIVGGPAGRWLQPAGHAFSSLAAGALISQTVVMVDTVGRAQKAQDLAALTTLIEDRQVTPVIDRTYPFGEMQAAVRYVEEGHVQGKVVVTVASP
jgi:NADPH:quinone reductase-like Zn-dependent oxidoreductase